MNIRIPQSGKAAKLAKSFLQTLGIEASHQQCLELVARLHGYQTWQAMQSDSRFSEAPALKAVSSSEFTLASKAGSAWIEVDNISVYVRRNDEGVSVDLFPRGQEDDDALAGTSLTFDEAREEAGGDESENAVWIQFDKEDGVWYWSSRQVPALTPSSGTRFEGARDKDWAGPFEDPKTLVASLCGGDVEDSELAFSWIRADKPDEAQCRVLQDDEVYREGVPFMQALAMARGLCDSGAGGIWTVEADDFEVVAIFV